MSSKIVKYLFENGIEDESKFNLRDDGNGVFIENWSYDVPKPDLSKLVDFTTDEQTEDVEKRNLLNKLDDIVVVGLKQKQIDKYDNKIKLFSLIYNKSTSVLQFKTKLGWKTLALI